MSRTGARCSVLVNGIALGCMQTSTSSNSTRRCELCTVITLDVMVSMSYCRKPWTSIVLHSRIRRWHVLKKIANSINPLCSALAPNAGRALSRG
jgi:hypothetical protein